MSDRTVCLFFLDVVVVAVVALVVVAVVALVKIAPATHPSGIAERISEPHRIQGRRVHGTSFLCTHGLVIDFTCAFESVEPRQERLSEIP
jgi:hypothetical protein